MDSPLLVTAAMIIEDNKILLVKRAREPYKDFWCFIGGCNAFKHVSDPVEAVKMEVKADINCSFEPKFFKYNHKIFDVPTITLFFHGKIKGTPKITPKYVSECGWFNLKEAAKLRLGFDHNQTLSEFIERFPTEHY